MNAHEKSGDADNGPTRLYVPCIAHAFWNDGTLAELGLHNLFILVPQEEVAQSAWGPTILKSASVIQCRQHRDTTSLK